MSVTTTARANARKQLLNQQEFKKLFDDYFEGICNYLYSHTKDWDVSEEIAQKTFVKLWEKRVQITINTSLKSYLYQSAKNSMIDEFRKNRYRSQFASRYEEITEKVSHIEFDDSDEKSYAKQPAEMGCDAIETQNKEHIFIKQTRWFNV